MNVLTVWMLLMISQGPYNSGNTYTKDFATKESCLFVRAEMIKMSGDYLTAKCIKVDIPVAK